MKDNFIVEIGDTIGMVVRNGKNYQLLELLVIGLHQDGDGVDRIIGSYMPTPYTVQEVAENTALMMHDQHIILTDRPFLTVPVKDRVQRWIMSANKNPGVQRNLISDPIIHIADDTSCNADRGNAESEGE